MVPFARTAQERKEHNDPRLSLQERYRSHEGYVQVVSDAAARAMAQGFLLPRDASDLVSAAKASAVLR
jgi:Alpha/beta hydrolase domain